MIKKILRIEVELNSFPNNILIHTITITISGYLNISEVQFRSFSDRRICQGLPFSIKIRFNRKIDVLINKLALE